MSAPDDQPLTVADTVQRGYGIDMLAERIAAHLGEGWSASADTSRLVGPEGATVRLAHAWGDDHTHLLGIYPDLPGPMSALGERVNLYLLPSQLARLIETAVLPGYRQALREARDAQSRTEAEAAARRGHAEAIAARLGADWAAVEGTYSVAAERPRKRSRVYGSFHWNHDGRMYLELRNATPELFEGIADLVGAHMDRHEVDGAAWLPRRPKRLNYLLELMVAAGYRIDTLGEEHKHLFGAYLFKMDMRSAPGDDLVGYLFHHPDAIDRAIRELER